MSTWRIALVAVLLAPLVAVGRAAATNVVSVVNLDAVPFAVGDRIGRDAGALDAETRRIVAADAYLNRTYSSADSAPIGLYMAYYAGQRPGASMHSPLHCLPGTGWEPVDVTSREVTTPGGGTGAVRRMVVRKGRDQAIVLYWYALHGRIVDSELASKAWLLRDAFVLHRSDAALVRVVVPFNDSPAAAERAGLAFVHDLLPLLTPLWS